MNDYDAALVEFVRACTAIVEAADGLARAAAPPNDTPEAARAAATCRQLLLSAQKIAPGLRDVFVVPA